MMLGKVDGATMIVMDVFALPVEGTETRVNAQSQAYEYMSTYVNAAKEVNTLKLLILAVAIMFLNIFNIIFLFDYPSILLG